MSTDVHGRADGNRTAPQPDHAHARRTRRRSWVLFAAAGWTAWVWLTRLGIVLDQRQSAGFRLVHGVLIVVSLGFAVALAVVGWRMRREAAEHSTDRTGVGGSAG